MAWDESAGPRGGAALAPPIPNLFDPVSTPAFAIRELAWLLIVAVSAIFALVGGLIAYALVRFRARSRDEGPERPPPQVYGSGPIELAWTVGPLLIVTVLFLVTARRVFEVGPTRGLDQPLRVRVIAHQWWWEFRYPDLHVVTANELHVPVSGPDQRRPTVLMLESPDVIHSFWVPQLAGKTDVIPGRVNETWIEPLETGTFVGQCGEFCGAQHANMALRVVVEQPDAFQRWVEAQRAPAVETASARAGRAEFESLACVSCHRVRGTGADGTVGPDLTHLMSRSTLGAGAVTNDAEHLRAWVADPATFKPGVNMPAMRLGEPELDRVVDYLRTLR